MRALDRLDQETALNELEDDLLEGSEENSLQVDGQFCQLKPDVLYEADDIEHYEVISRSTEFPLLARVFLEGELSKLLNHHEIKLNAEERADKIVNEALALAEEMNKRKMWPLKFGFKAALRIALKKTIYFKYKKDFELSGIAKIRVQRRYPTAEEQMQRHRALVEVWSLAKKDALLRSDVLDLARKALKMELLPETFNRNVRGNISSEQINDLATNWIFTYMSRAHNFDGRLRLDENHKVLLVLMMCRSFNLESLVIEYARLQGAKLDKAYVEVGELIEELRNTFEISTDRDFQAFLMEEKIDGSESGHKKLEVIQEKDGQKRSDRISVIQSYLNNLRSEVETENISTDARNMALRYVDLLKAKHGNLTGRNNSVRSLLRFAFNKGRRSRGSITDNIAEANLILVEKVITYDFRLGFSPTTYLSSWLNQGITRRVDEDRDVRIPIHIVEKIKTFRRFWRIHPEMSQTEVLDAFLQQYPWPRFVKMLREGDFLSGGFSMDKPINTDESDGATIGEFFATENEDHQIGKQAENLDLRHKMEQALNCLPPFYAVITRLRMGLVPGYYGQAFTLKQVGYLFDMSRERVRQIEEMIRQGITGTKMPVFDALCYSNEEEFDQYVRSKGCTTEQLGYLKMMYGLDPAFLYRKMRARDVVLEVKQRFGIDVKKEDIQKLREKFRGITPSGLMEISMEQSFEYAREILEAVQFEFGLESALEEKMNEHVKIMGNPMSKIDWKTVMAGRVPDGEEDDEVPEQPVEFSLLPSNHQDELNSGENTVIDTVEVETTASSLNDEIFAVLKGVDVKHLPIARAVLSGKAVKEIAEDLKVPLGSVMMISAKVRMMIANNK